MTVEQTLLSTEHVQEFLDKYYKNTVEKVFYISGGKHSEAFLYSAQGHGEYVIRFNVNDKGFLKDRYAYEHFSNNDIIIPKIYDIGKYNGDIFYCISDKINGETPKEQYKRRDFTSLQIQFETIEKIKDIKIPEDFSMYGEFDTEHKPNFSSFSEYIKSMYVGDDLFAWSTLRLLPYFDEAFFKYLVTKVEELTVYSEGIGELTHGDFGNDNLFIKDNKESGIIDWERVRIGDHFLDVGRVVLFCPNREETVRVALDFYSKKTHAHFKERIAFGVYVAMLRNYAAALTEGKESSCRNYPKTIDQFENLINL